MRNMLLETRGQAILVTKWQRNWMNCVCVLVLWKTEPTSNEIGYLAEEISKQSVESTAWFFLTAYRKMQKGRSALRMKLLSKNKAETKHLENSHPICISKQSEN